MNQRLLALVPAAAILAAGLLPGQTAQRVKNTVHNLSVTGPGAIRAADETEVCVFCHTPHGASEVRPLWNRSLAAGPYLIYQSSSLRAKPGQPTGASKLCLSCHDGTIALGTVLSRAQPIAMTGTDRIPPGPANLGTDLSDDHPISFPYATSLTGGNPELFPAGSIPPPVKLDVNGELQCTSCHEPHDDSYGKFLVRPNERSAICTSCHRMLSWPTSIHATSGAAIPPDVAASLGADPTTAAQNACKGCHHTHGAPGKPWITARETINVTCTTCHNGTVATASIEREIGKISSHGISLDLTPGIIGGPYLEGNRVSCGDCHNAHAAGSSDGLPAGVPASLARVPGVTIGGSPVAAVSYEYELCFRCHGDAPAQVTPLVSRQINQPDKRLQFQANNPSYHPVVYPGVNPLVPSLIPPLITGSLITCGDCHASDDTRSLGGSGPAGPHGSIYRALLVRRYDTMDGSGESPAAYALCYRCHQRDSILRNDSFPDHEKHIVEVRTPCSACHDPHGISSAQGTVQHQSRLINFDRSVVFPNAVRRLEYVTLGPLHGQCFLNCHGREHNPEEY